MLLRCLSKTNLGRLIFRNRQTRRDLWGNRTRWLEWTDAEPEPATSWKILHYDPRLRPWYQGAIGINQNSETPLLSHDMAQPLSGSLKLYPHGRREHVD